METEKKETKKRKAEGSEKIVLVPHSPSSAGFGTGLQRSSMAGVNLDEEEETEGVGRLPPDTKADSPPTPWWRGAAKWFLWFLAIVAYAAVVAAIVVWYAAIGAFIVANIIPIAVIAGVVGVFVLAVLALAKLEEWASRQQEVQENEAFIDSVESTQPEEVGQPSSISVSLLQADGLQADNQPQVTPKTAAAESKAMETEPPKSSSSFRETDSSRVTVQEAVGTAPSVSALPSTIVSSEQPLTKELVASSSLATLSAAPVAPMPDSNVTETPSVSTNTAQETKMSKFKNTFSGIAGMLSNATSTVKGAINFMLEIDPLHDTDDTSDVDTPTETATNHEPVKPETVIVKDTRDDEGEDPNRTVGLP